MPLLEHSFIHSGSRSESSRSLSSTISVSDPVSDKKRNDNKNICKRVKFNTSVQVVLIKSCTEIPESQKQSVWYSSEESKTIRNDAINTVRKMTKNQPLGPDETSRGLETKTPKEHRALRECTQRTIFVVLREQYRVAEERWGSEERVDAPEPSFDHEYVAALYRHNSRQAVSEAIRLAAMDAEEARGI